MALKIPQSLRLTELKHLAFKCGIANSGTKGTLSQRLHDDISSVPKVPVKDTRVLSIDMGIRNLAYCILDVPAKPAVNAKSWHANTTIGGEISNAGDAVPSIISWHRLAVSSAPEKVDGVKVKEAFDPATLSNTAYILLRERLLRYDPTHILIERQRFRSMGSKHILEWTIRVNMFESILYAVLCTLKAEGIWKGDVIPVVPGRVGPFWLEDHEPGSAGLCKARTSKNTKTHNKGLKIDLVRRWLEAGNVVGLGSVEVTATVQQYKDKWDRAPGAIKGRKKGDAQVDTGKLDDLADCLLQGMAWVSWQQNKRTLLDQGVEAFVEVKLPPPKAAPKVGAKTKRGVKKAKLVSAATLNGPSAGLPKTLPKSKRAPKKLA